MAIRKMIFSIEDFKDSMDTLNLFPGNFFPYIGVEKTKFKKLEEIHKESGVGLDQVYLRLKNRTSKEYFNKIYPAQSSVLSYSERVFPAYRFLIPEVLSDDWLGIVDLHKKFGRDHALHQPLTAYVVAKLLGGGVSNRSFQIDNTNLLDLCIDSIFNTAGPRYIFDYIRGYGCNINEDLLKRSPTSEAVWKAIFYESAVVSAMFHDIGYPWQFINKLNTSISAASFIQNEFLSDAKNIHYKYLNRLILYPFNNYRKSDLIPTNNWSDDIVKLISNSLSLTHGFPGALGFTYLTDYVREPSSFSTLPYHQLCYDWAALGIMMHDMEKMYSRERKDNPDNNKFRLDFKVDPLSAIVTLADLIEDFERPAATFNSFDTHSHIQYNSSCISTELQVKDDILEILYSLNNRDATLLKREFIKKEEVQFFEPAKGYLDLSALGIRKVKMYAN